MKLLNKIVGTIFVLCGLFSVVGILLLWVKPKSVESCSQFFTVHNLGIGLAALLIFIAGILWLVNWFDHIYRTKAIAFDNPGGKVQVSLRAIEEFVASRISVQVLGVKSIKVKSSFGSKGLETFINLKFLAGVNIPDTCAHIQEITKNYLQDVVGVERISSIEILVSRIIVGKENDIIEGTEEYEESEHIEPEERT